MMSSRAGVNTRSPVRGDCAEVADPKEVVLGDGSTPSNGILLAPSPPRDSHKSANGSLVDGIGVHLPGKLIVPGGRNTESRY